MGVLFGGEEFVEMRCVHGLYGGVLMQAKGEGVLRWSGGVGRIGHDIQSGMGCAQA